MCDFSIAMALVDFIPVVFFAVSAVLMMRDSYFQMPKYGFAMLAAGTINVFSTGFLKATWKLLYAAGICDFHALNTLFLPTQSLGFLMAGIAMGNDTLIFELYDTLLGEAQLVATEKAKRRGKDLPEHDVGSHWYDSIKLPVSLAKKGKRSDTVRFDKLAESYILGFLSDCGCAASCEVTPKLEKVSEYVEGLLSHGGPSTDVFKKAMGEEKTAELFRKVLFGTGI